MVLLIWAAGVIWFGWIMYTEAQGDTLAIVILVLLWPISLGLVIIAKAYDIVASFKRSPSCDL